MEKKYYYKHGSRFSVERQAKKENMRKLGFTSGKSYKRFVKKMKWEGANV